MSKFQIKSFIIGKEKIPTWFNDEVSKCRAKINYDEDGDLTNVIIYSPTKQFLQSLSVGLCIKSKRYPCIFRVVFVSVRFLL